MNILPPQRTAGGVVSRFNADEHILSGPNISISRHGGNLVED